MKFHPMIVYIRWAVWSCSDSLRWL